MKKIILHIGAVSAAVAVLAGAYSCNREMKGDTGTEQTPGKVCETPEGAIVYFNLDSVMLNYDMAVELRKEVEGKAAEIEKDLDRRKKKLEKEVSDFNNQLQKGLMTQAIAQEKSQALGEKQMALEKLVMTRTQEMQEEQMVMMNRIADAVKTFLDEYNGEKGYAMILSTQGALLPAPVCVADKSLDITDDVLEGLNAAYSKKTADEGSDEED